jgi:signal transduction histidine kinase
MMKPESARLSRNYQAALQKHLKGGRSTGAHLAIGLGRRAATIGLGTLEMARIHQQALIQLVVPSCSPAARAATIRRAGTFFAEAITPIESIHRTALETNARMSQLNRLLHQRTVELAASKRQLKQETEQRRLTEKSLKKSERHYALLLQQSRNMQDQLRLLSRQLLSAQEEERKKISRELHDVIAQTLTSINVRLAKLRKEATLNASGLERSIAMTQQLVVRSVNIVHRFARELRPTVLDDLGLIPALHTYMKHFRAETGIRVSLSAFAKVEQVKGDKRTVLYRVAQEALTNVARHAQASYVAVKVQENGGAICMKIIDNGKGFQEERVFHARKCKRLGLLGMRERLEMVGGNFSVTSVPGKGTTVFAQIPLIDRHVGRRTQTDQTRSAKL